MQPHERGGGGGHVSHHQHDRLLGLELHPVGHDPEASPPGRQVGLGDPLHEVFPGPTMANELLDRDDLQAMPGGEREQAFAVGPVAGIIEDLADHPGRRPAGEPREVDRRLGVARAAEHAALLGHEGKEVSRADEVGRRARRVEDGGDGRRPLRGGDAGLRRPVVDGHGEGGAERGGVGRHHHREVEPPGHVGQDRHADLAAALANHEVHHLGGGGVGRADEVAFVLAILVVGHDHHLPAGDRGDGGFDGREAGGHGRHRAGVWELAAL